MVHVTSVILLNLMTHFPETSMGFDIKSQFGRNSEYANAVLRYSLSVVLAQSNSQTFLNSLLVIQFHYFKRGFLFCFLSITVNACGTNDIIKIARKKIFSHTFILVQINSQDSNAILIFEMKWLCFWLLCCNSWKNVRQALSARYRKMLSNIFVRKTICHSWKKSNLKY